MITELTPEQKDLLAVYRDRWIAKGLCTDPVDEMSATEIVTNIVTKILKRNKPDHVFVMPSPIASWLLSFSIQYIEMLCEQMEKRGGAGVLTETLKDITSNVTHPNKNISTSIFDHVYGVFSGYIKDSGRLAKCIEAGIKGKDKRGAAKKATGCADDASNEDIANKILQVLSRHALNTASNTMIVWPYLSGHFWAGWHAYYAYMNEVLGVNLCDEYFVLARQVELGPIWPLDNVVVVSDRPMQINMRNNALHSDGSPAIVYRDGFSCWALNGVLVPSWLAQQKAEDIEPSKFAEIENAEIRREFVRKVGIERISSSCGAKCIDKDGDYELLVIDLGGQTGKWPYLKMLNPSIGVWHLECVDKKCKTVKDAINWRASSVIKEGENWNPEILT